MKFLSITVTVIFSLLVSAYIFLISSVNKQGERISNEKPSESLIAEVNVPEKTEETLPSYDMHVQQASNDSTENEVSTYETTGLDPDLLNWYLEMNDLTEGKSVYSPEDEDYGHFLKKMLEDPEEYMKLAARSDLSNIYLTMVLEELPSEETHLLLPYLDKKTQIADIAYRLNMHKKYPVEFERALNAWPMKPGYPPPYGLVVPAIQSGNKSYLDAIEQAAIEGFNQLELFETIATSEFRNMTVTLADDVWSTYDKTSHIYTRFDAAYVAAKYAGNKDALLELANVISIADENDRSYLEGMASDLTSYNVDMKKFDSLAETLFYNFDMGWWDLPG
jgi:hypothetical protein